MLFSRAVNGRDFCRLGERHMVHKTGPSKEKNSFSLLAIVTEAGTLGLTLAICLIAGVYIGRYIDSIMETSPWGLICCSFLGAVTGFWSLYKKALRYMKEDNQNRHGSHTNQKDTGGPD